MRILDIAVAAGYAVLCVSLIALLSPYPVEGSAAKALSDGRASSAVADYVSSAGFPFLATASLSQFCGSLRASGNQTVLFGGTINGASCGPAPLQFLGSSSFRFSVSGNQVEIEAWVEGP